MLVLPMRAGAVGCTRCIHGHFMDIRTRIQYTFYQVRRPLIFNLYV